MLCSTVSGCCDGDGIGLALSLVENCDVFELDVRRRRGDNWTTYKIINVLSFQLLSLRATNNNTTFFLRQNIHFNTMTSVAQYTTRPSNYREGRGKVLHCL